jgi:diacylglycerol kinase family enzyme
MNATDKSTGTMASLAPGADLAILVNANAKRGGRRIAAQLKRALPKAEVRLTRTIGEIEGWLQGLGPKRCILAAGGDGTCVALLGALDRVLPPGAPMPTVGALPLGTGNAWAHALGARKLDFCVRALSRWDGAVPTKRYTLFSCEDTLTFFAGCGWDAQVLDDFRKQVEQSPSRRAAKSVWGYLSAMALRTAPKAILHGRPHVIIENLADEVFTMGADGQVRRAPLGRGSILYDGLASVAGAATCPEFGYRFRAYPFAERMQGFMNIRVYDEATHRAVRAIPKLWRGEHPMPGMSDWFSTHVRFIFSRPIPLQIGGEALGSRQTVECKVSPRTVQALDWRRVFAA